jgi:UDP-glucose 4,6-dehydratase
MIVLLGNTGYVGQAFEMELSRRKLPFLGLSRRTLDYSRFDHLLRFLQEYRPEFLINAAGYTGKPNVDACENHKADTLHGNALFPAVVAHACLAADIPWGHVSSGCIFSGAKVETPDGLRAERDLLLPALQSVVRETPSKIHGYSETDEPNFSFRRPECSFYSGTKALGEEAIHGVGRNYIWRLRIPFDHINNPRNYLSKVQNYSKVYDNVNSLSHRFDFVNACLDLWLNRAPFGIYNMTNPGFVTTRRVVNLIERVLKPARRFEFWSGDEEFYRLAAKTPRSNCVLDVSKLLSTGVKMRSIEEALADSLQRWVQ